MVERESCTRKLVKVKSTLPRKHANECHTLSSTASPVKVRGPDVKDVASLDVRWMRRQAIIHIDAIHQRIPVTWRSSFEL